MIFKTRSDVWDVFLDGNWIDTVFCTVGSYEAEEMRKSLIDHDGYDPQITVKRG